MSEENALQAPPEQAPVTDVSPAPSAETLVVAAPVEETRVPLKALEDERRKRQERDEENAYLRGQLEAIQKQGPPAPATSPAPFTAPRQEDFDTWEQFEDAREKYLTERMKAEMAAEFVKHQTEIAQRQQAEQVHSQFMARVQEAAKTDPELLLIATAQGEYRNLPINNAMAAVIKQSETGPLLLRYLANNRGEALRISQLDPIIAASTLGMIAHQITTAPKPTPAPVISAAPPPISTVNNNLTPQGFDPQTASMRDYYRKVNEEEGYVRR